MTSQSGAVSPSPSPLIGSLLVTLSVVVSGEPPASVTPLPSFFLNTTVVLPGAGVGPLPSKHAVAPKPTLSTTVAPLGHEVPDGMSVLTLSSATFPAVPLIAMLPVASGVGRLV